MTTKTSTFTDEDVRRVAETVKSEILEDIANGVLPETISTYSELHDYVDANGYGGFLDAAFEYGHLWNEEDQHGLSTMIRFANKVSHLVDQWLRAGRPEQGAVA